MKTTVIRALMSAIRARENCAKWGNAEWHAKHSERIAQLAADFLPSGSGVDNGTRIDLDETRADRLVLECDFHHMSESGMYDGWTSHTVTVTPDWEGVSIHVGGRNRNQIKDYLAELFDSALGEVVDWDDAAGRYRPAQSA